MSDLRTLADSWEKLRAEARTGSSIARGQLAGWLDANSDDIISLLRSLRKEEDGDFTFGQRIRYVTDWLDQ